MLICQTNQKLYSKNICIITKYNQSAVLFSFHSGFALRCFDFFTSLHLPRYIFHKGQGNVMKTSSLRQILKHIQTFPRIILDFPRKSREQLQQLGSLNLLKHFCRTGGWGWWVLELYESSFSQTHMILKQSKAIKVTTMNDNFLWSSRTLLCIFVGANFWKTPWNSGGL